jgi:YcxB-like protein
VLRGRAFGPSGNAWQFRLGFADFVLTEVPSLWRSHPFLMSEAHAAGLLWFSMVAYDMYHSTGPGVVWGWSVAGVLLFFTVTTQFWYFLLRYVTPSNSLRLPWEAEFSDRGAHLKNSKTEYFSAWTTFRKFREGRRCFLLYVSSSRYSIFPKRCLSSEQEGILRKLLKEKVAVE